MNCTIKSTNNVCETLANIFSVTGILSRQATF